MLRHASFSIAMILSICFVSQVRAGQDGLGSHWPNAVDVSRNPSWHVYVFRQAGVEYIQVNDLNGTVREAIATAGGQFLALPMGQDASRVSTPQESALTHVTNAATCAPPECINNHAAMSATQQVSNPTSQLVYRDNAVIITVATDVSGNLQWSNKANNVINADTCEPPECGGIIVQPPK